MRIAFIGQKGIPAKFGGVERHVEELAVRMAKQGQEVFVYSRKNYVDEKVKDYKGVKLIFIPSISTKNLDAISHTFFSIFHILFHKYDVVHFHSIGPTSLSWIVKILKPKTKLVATFHCQDYYHQKWNWFAKKFLMFGEWITCTVPDETIVVSRLLKNYVQKKHGRKTTYIPNGSAVSINMGINEIAKWNLKPQEYILSVGRLIRHKNIHQLVQSFIKLKQQKLILDKYKLVIVGDGFHTDSYVAELKKEAQGRRDIIFTGTQSGNNIEQLFSHAKLFVQPSSDEGLSLVILEALGYQLPVLVSDIPENIEAAQGLALTFKVNDVDDLGGKLQTALSSSTFFGKDYFDNASNVVSNLFNWGKITRKILNIYER
jgi:glycosyltransferase involved in cell wall biosynthesis